MKIYVKYKFSKYVTSVDDGCLGCAGKFECFRPRIKFGGIDKYEFLYCKNWRIYVEGSH